MIFYTVQKPRAWEKAQLTGSLTGNLDYIDKDWFHESYKWMMEQMSKRLPKYKGEYPVWLWLSTDSICFSELLKDNWVLLEVDIPESHVLISNFCAWNVVINGQDFNETNEIISKKESWNYIFDSKKLIELGYSFDKDDLQGVIGSIPIKNITPVTYITNEQKSKKEVYYVNSFEGNNKVTVKKVCDEHSKPSYTLYNKCSNCIFFTRKPYCIDIRHIHTSKNKETIRAQKPSCCIVHEYDKQALSLNNKEYIQQCLEKVKIVISKNGGVVKDNMLHLSELYIQHAIKLTEHEKTQYFKPLIKDITMCPFFKDTNT